MINGAPTKKVHISEIKAGDTVVVGGRMETVSKHHLTKSDFFGHQYKGYCHHESKGFIELALFPIWSKGKLVRYATQVNG